MTRRMNYLNVGCGSKYHKSWINIDICSSDPNVISCNILNGIPFPDNQFEVVYHSQVLEHIPKENSLAFMKECYRVLDKNGIIRVVVPNLENIVDEYKRLLNENLTEPDEKSALNYDWIMIELFDQTVRNKSGGLMKEFLQQNKNTIDKQFISDRIGYIGQVIMNDEIQHDIPKSKVSFLKSLPGRIKNKIFNVLLGDNYKIGKFRLGGEIHYWMYDGYSLSRLLRESGFKDISIKNAFESDIKNWSEYELDVKNNIIFDPASLFIEAKK